MKVRPIFAWYDLWIGVFIDRPKRRIYIFPLPCLGIVMEYRCPDCGKLEGKPSTGVVTEKGSI